MESSASSRNRRQNSKDPNPKTAAQQSEVRKVRGDSQHERRWSEDDEPWDDNGFKSDSDRGRHSEASDDGQDDEETGLTGQGKNKQRRQRKHNRRLDHRIVGEDEITKDEKKEADQSVLKNMLINAFFILLWYVPVALGCPYSAHKTDVFVLGTSSRCLSLSTTSGCSPLSI